MTEQAKQPAKEYPAKESIIGLAMRDMADGVEMFADNGSSVLFIGPTGVGKELLARVYAERREKDLVVINCSEFTPLLIQGELFGHVKGAFTGALSERVGIIAQAAKEDKVLLLDEFQELEPHLQALFLRVMDTHEYRRLGDDKPQRLNNTITFLATTSAPDRIREDIRFRFDFQFHIRSLTERTFPYRKADVEHWKKAAREMGVRRKKGLPSLIRDMENGVDYESDFAEAIEHCLRGAAQKQGDVDFIAEGALAFIYFRPWPGNYRQLERSLAVASMAARRNPEGSDTVRCPNIPEYSVMERLVHPDIPYNSNRGIPIFEKGAIVQECANLHETIGFEMDAGQDGDSFIDGKQTLSELMETAEKHLAQSSGDEGREDLLAPFRECRSPKEARELGLMFLLHLNPQREGETQQEHRERLGFKSKGTYDKYRALLKKWTEKRSDSDR